MHVVVKLDYDATASYTGDIAGLAATSPKVTGKKLTGKSGAEQRLRELHRPTRQELPRPTSPRRVPPAQAGQSLQRVYGGVAVTVPANQISTVLGTAERRRRADRRAQQAADRSRAPSSSAHRRSGPERRPSARRQGRHLRRPRHRPVAGAPDRSPTTRPSARRRPRRAATPRECNYGDNPLTPAADVFECNNKVIGGAPFIDTYNALIGGEVFPDSARDSNGHGTHTTSTAAGDASTTLRSSASTAARSVASPPAHGSSSTRSAACRAASAPTPPQPSRRRSSTASTSSTSRSRGGAQPFTDPVELAFLDAYNAGITVAASAGNSGPGAGTTDHHGPWVITVAASTQSREFQSTLTVTLGRRHGNVRRHVADHRHPRRRRRRARSRTSPGYDDACCSTPLPAGSATGKIVACQRGGVGAASQKGSTSPAGGAVGMILYNLPLADTESDNHFLPTIHLADGTEFLAFMAAHPDADRHRSPTASRPTVKAT